MDAVFKVINVKTVSGEPRRPASVYSRSTARSPSGVAALDSPSRFAVTLALTSSMASLSFAALPNSGRSRGVSAWDSFSANPEARITSITPLQKHIRPAMLMANVTASDAPVPTAAVTASNRPVTAPQSRARARNATQITESIYASPLPCRKKPVSSIQGAATWIDAGKGMNEE